MRLICFLRWARNAGWRDAFYAAMYPLRTWRCRLFGHDWGPEEHDYDPYITVLVESSRSCRRKNCEGWWETYNAFAPGKQRIIG